MPTIVLITTAWVNCSAYTTCRSFFSEVFFSEQEAQRSVAGALGDGQGHIVGKVADDSSDSGRSRAVNVTFTKAW